MNAARRKNLKEILAKLSEVRSDLEAIASEERDAFDNLPQGLQEGDRGQAMDAAATALEDAFSELETMESTLEELLEG